MNFETLVPYLIEWAAIIGLTLLASTSARFKHPRVTFNHARREGIGGLLLAGFALVVSLGFAWLNPLELSFSEEALNPLVYGLILAGITALPFGSTLWARRQKLFTAGWLPGMFRAGLMFGLACGILLIFLAGKFLGILDGLVSVEIISLVVLLVASLLEESIFRGYLQCRMQAWLGQMPGWLLTAAIFFLWSLPLSWLFGQLSGFALIVLAVRSLIAGWVMQKTGHVLAPAFYRAFALWILFLQ